MLLQFALTNYRSFRDRKELKLRRPTVEVVKEFPEPGVAPAIAIFGPNSSGKTNLLRGLRDMFSMIRSSASEAEAGLPYTPFMLGDHDGQPTTFEVAVLLGGVRYEYGFTFDAAFRASGCIHGRRIDSACFLSGTSTMRLGGSASISLVRTRK